MFERYFGQLQVISHITDCQYLACQCTCGRYLGVSKTKLETGEKTSCGECLPPRIDLDAVPYVNDLYSLSESFSAKSIAALNYQTAKAYSSLASYATLRAQSITARKDGLREEALILETKADRVYVSLPLEYRW